MALPGTFMCMMSMVPGLNIHIVIKYWTWKATVVVLTILKSEHPCTW